MAKYYTRHQSLKHIWYQRYNSRSNTRDDGVVPWHAKCGFKKEAWAKGKQAAWQQLMKERELLYNNENIAKAEIINIEKTKSNSTKLWVNIENPYAEKWDFGDINTVTISKNKEDLYVKNYENPRIGSQIFVKLNVYHRKGNTGFSYKIKYKKTEQKRYDKSRSDKKMYNDSDPVTFDELDYNEIQNAFRISDQAQSIMQGAIAIEDIDSFKNGKAKMNSAINKFENININKFNYNIRHKYFIEENIMGIKRGIIENEIDWIYEVDLPNSTKEEENVHYKKLLDKFIAYAELFKNQADLRLKRAENNDLINHKNGMVSFLYYKAAASALFFVINPSKKNMDESIKLFIKWIDYTVKIPNEESNSNNESMEATREYIISNSKSESDFRNFLIEHGLIKS